VSSNSNSRNKKIDSDKKKIDRDNINSGSREKKSVSSTIGMMTNRLKKKGNMLKPKLVRKVKHMISTNRYISRLMLLKSGFRLMEKGDELIFLVKHSPYIAQILDKFRENKDANIDYLVDELNKFSRLDSEISTERKVSQIGRVVELVLDKSKNIVSRLTKMQTYNKLKNILNGLNKDIIYLYDSSPSSPISTTIGRAVGHLACDVCAYKTYKSIKKKIDKVKSLVGISVPSRARELTYKRAFMTAFEESFQVELERYLSSKKVCFKDEVKKRALWYKRRTIDRLTNALSKKFGSYQDSSICKAFQLASCPGRRGVDRDWIVVKSKIDSKSWVVVDRQTVQLAREELKNEEYETTRNIGRFAGFQLAKIACDALDENLDWQLKNIKERIRSTIEFRSPVFDPYIISPFVAAAQTAFWEEAESVLVGQMGLVSRSTRQYLSLSIRRVASWLPRIRLGVRQKEEEWVLVVEEEEEGWVVVPGGSGEDGGDTLLSS
jgi:hypothetical protein